MKENRIQLKFSGEGISPSSIRASELGEMLVLMEKAISSRIRSSDPKISPDEIVIGLVEVLPGSASFVLEPQVPEMIMPSFNDIAFAINEADYQGLSPESLEMAKNMATFSRKRGCNIELDVLNGNSRTLATITPQTTIETLEDIRGTSTIYGKLKRIGGSEPKAQIELAEHIVLNCEIINEEVAKKLAQYLYSWVGLQGDARWNPVDFSLNSFRVTEIIEQDDIPLSQTFEELKASIGKHFSDVDPDEYVNLVRYGE